MSEEVIILVCDHYGSRSIDQANLGDLIIQHHQRITAKVAGLLAANALGLSKDDLWSHQPTFVEGDRVGFIFRATDVSPEGVAALAREIVADDQINHTSVALSRGRVDGRRTMSKGPLRVPFHSGEAVRRLDVASDYCPEGRILSTYSTERLRTKVDLSRENDEPAEAAMRVFWTTREVVPGEIFDERDVRARLLTLHSALLAAEKIIPLLDQCFKAIDLRPGATTISDLCLVRDALSLLQSSLGARSVETGDYLARLGRKKASWTKMFEALVEGSDSEISEVVACWSKLPSCIEESDVYKDTEAFIHLFRQYDLPPFVGLKPKNTDLLSTIGPWKAKEVVDAVERHQLQLGDLHREAKSAVEQAFTLHRSWLVPQKQEA